MKLEIRNQYDTWCTEDTLIKARVAKERIPPSREGTSQRLFNGGRVITGSSSFLALARGECRVPRGRDAHRVNPPLIA
jgi:hypothetical protein